MNQKNRTTICDMLRVFRTALGDRIAEQLLPYSASPTTDIIQALTSLANEEDAEVYSRLDNR